MLSFDMSIVVLVLTIIYAVSQGKVLKYLSGYGALLAFMITCFQLLVDYGSTPVLSVLFYFSIVIFVVVFFLDVIFYFPTLFDLIMVAVGKRRKPKGVKQT